MKRCEAPDCEVDFEPQRSTARYCTATCRQRAGRARKAAAESVEADQAAGTKEHQLVRAARLELEQAEAVDTVNGQLALQLARQLANPDGTGLSTLSKEFRSVMAAALEGRPTPEDPDEPTAEPVEDDEVTRARRQREQARQAAGLA